MAKSKTKHSQFDADVERIADECIAVRMRMLNRVVTNVYDEAIRPLGITAGQSNILVAVQRRGRPRQAEVSRALHMEKSTMSRNIDRLLKNGLLTITEDADDRANYLSVTAKGRALISKSIPLWETAQQRAREIVGVEGEKGLRSAANALWRESRNS